jgi:hypothetical protein
MMQWDIGYGKFSGGLTYRPKLDISYTINEAKLDFQSSLEFTVTKDVIEEDSLVSGFDKNGNKLYGCIEFDLSNLPEMNNTVISNAYIELEAKKVNSKEHMRFHIEMITPIDGELSYKKIQNREVIERIGYDVSVADLKEVSKQRFVFDKFAINEMLEMADNKKVLFVISSTSQKQDVKNEDVSWVDAKRIKRPSLIVSYIKKRRSAPQQVSNLEYTIENGIGKLTWKIPEGDDINGVIVVKNPFRIPCSPYDGQKLYGGNDNYTYDNFGDSQAHKYYAVFSYDDVPNFSKAVSLEINI